MIVAAACSRTEPGSVDEPPVGETAEVGFAGDGDGDEEDLVGRLARAGRRLLDAFAHGCVAMEEVALGRGMPSRCHERSILRQANRRTATATNPHDPGAPDAWP